MLAGMQIEGEAEIPQGAAKIGDAQNAVRLENTQSMIKISGVQSLPKAEGMQNTQVSGTLYPEVDISFNALTSQVSTLVEHIVKKEI